MLPLGQPAHRQILPRADEISAQRIYRCPDCPADFFTSGFGLFAANKFNGFL